MAVFLFGLNALDTYRLLTLRRVGLAMLAGALAAAICYPLNTVGFTRWGGIHGIAGAPVIEELAKALYVFHSIARRRVGFPVDAAVTGFAVGAGFALLENLVYLFQLAPADSSVVWLVRGFGTALMHGGTTAIVAIVTVTMAGKWKWMAAIPALAVGVALHAVYNLGALPPLERTAAILLTLPLLLAAVFWKSERMLERWLDGKLDSDIEVLSMIDSGTFLQSARGRYLAALRDSFPAEIVADMFCLIRMSAELSAKTKGELLRREMGFPPEPDPERGAFLKEMAHLERTIGRAGRSALAPMMPASARDAWERQWTQ